MDEPIYPRLVRAFYAAAVVHKEDSYLENTIKGISIVLTLEYIAEALGIEDHGSRVFESQWYSTTQVRRSEVLQRLLKDPKER